MHNSQHFDYEKVPKQGEQWVTGKLITFIRSLF